MVLIIFHLSILFKKGDLVSMKKENIFLKQLQLLNYFSYILNFTFFFF